MSANQSACVEAINAYIQNNGSSGLIVCSRLKEYTDRPVRLKVAGAICLQPLTPEQVKDYVAPFGGCLSGIRAALEKDAVLERLAETPLMLEVMSLAYGDVPAEALASEHSTNNWIPRKRGEPIPFNTYIGKMLSVKVKGNKDL